MLFRSLELRAEADESRRRQLAGRLVSRLSECRQVEDYHPPFPVVSGAQLAESLRADLLREEFLFPHLEPEAASKLAG